MKKGLLIGLLCVFALCSCDNRIGVDKGGTSLNAGEYALKISSNCDGLSLSLTDEEYKSLIDSAISKDPIIPFLHAAAHDKFDTTDDIFNPAKWYTGLSDDPDVSTMNPLTLSYFTEEEPPFEKNSKNRLYVFRYDLILSVSEDLGDVQINIDEVILPDVNVLSFMFVGPDGFQERESDGDVVTPGIVIKSMNSQKPVLFSILIYLNGNDENCYTNNIHCFNTNTGEFYVKLNATAITE